MENTYAIELTQLESLYLSDALSMFTQGPPDALPSQASPYPGLLLKIGSAVLETEQRKAPVVVEVTIGELWIIREVAKSSVVVGNERVGLTLLLKIYGGIRTLAADSDVQLMVSAFGESMVDEPERSQFTAQLNQIRSGEDIGTGGKSNDNRETEDNSHKSSDTNENRSDNDASA